ncbi:DUF3352 domain-containing protein [Conexibacter sp. JD483]|uniref:DUF3352 domain-containing protein n=1 Tax=unclassified Conexibacter TaxID=2627773 RepID=UPI0027218353|nr:MULTISPECIES: DUF3352 domain-containing protein [unclassified Conexibacter]MDO8187182.1 DUF3352 domain-containing protein [Conexibacter sp. CPCC 205706]MDO8199279.1 DUF3352 domain-containing protein [Conexibacter sp. CPCC 205762]MDR9369320.1 DUF3352 domain-containing protein [Conexibacter sp. JD483]
MRPLAVGVAVALSATFAVACGSSDDESASSPTEGPAKLAPSSATAYGEVLVRPSGDVAEGVETAARRMLRVTDAGGELRRLLDEGFAEDGERDVFSKRIDPFLGDTIGGFLLIDTAQQVENPDGAVVISVRDRDAAERFLDEQESRGRLGERRTYAGVDYWVEDDGSSGALVDDFLVAGTETGLRAAIDTSRGGSLADESRFKDAVDDLPSDRLAWAYAEPRAIVNAVQEGLRQQAQLNPSLSAQLEQQQEQIERTLGNEPLTAAVTARADQVVVDFTSASAEIPQGGDGAVDLGGLPGAAWAALAIPPLGDAFLDELRQSGDYDEVARQLRAATALDLERDVFGWLGGIGAFVGGTSPLDLSAGIVIGSTDAAGSERFVARLERLAGAIGLQTTPTTGAGRGFQVRIPDFPQPLAVIARDDKVVLGLGVSSTRDAVDPSETLGDTEPGKSAIASLGDGYDPAFVLVPQPLLTLLSAVGVDQDPEFQQALPYLQAYRSIVAGSRSEDGKTTGRLVLNLQDPDENP